jgi:hypothetical protein
MFRLLRGLCRVIRLFIMPYSCWLSKMCCAYADCGLLFLIYLMCVLDSVPSGCGWFGPHTTSCRKCRLVGKFPICCGLEACDRCVV